MKPSALNAFDVSQEHNPVVGRLARQLEASLGAGRRDLDRSSLKVVERMLEFAAEAEQRIIEQSQRISYLEALSITDELTGLLNRRGFYDVLERTLANARRHKEHGVLVYVDLDGFKSINDTYGHEAGDAVLQRAAEILKANTRDTDYLARLGGDEFAALLVRGNQRSLSIRLLYLSDVLNASEVDFNGVSLPVRGSVGAAPYDPDTSVEALMREADAAMYRAKRLAHAADEQDVAASENGREADAAAAPVALPLAQGLAVA
ncbi:MAG: GGDEF domain-containing protein [Pseudomonadota bacterium]